MQCNRPTDSKNGEFKRVYYVFSLLIYSPFALRIVSRAFITKTLWWDDFFHMVAVVRTALDPSSPRVPWQFANQPLDRPSPCL